MTSHRIDVLPEDMPVEWFSQACVPEKTPEGVCKAGT